MITRRRSRREPSSREELDAQRLAAYRAHRKKFGELALRAVLRAVATMEAVSAVNDRIEDRYGLEGIRLDVGTVNAVVTNILAMEISAALAGMSSLSARDKRELVARLVARTVPRRDNVPQVLADRRQQQTPTVEQIEHVVARELRRSGLRSSNRFEGDGR